MATDRKVSFPHMGSYSCVFRLLAEMIGDQVIIAPPITKKTIDLGFKYSPESVCIPFKYNLGNFIEALDMGANVLIQAGGGCRFGYYGEVQEEILRRLGYEFEFVKLSNRYGIIESIKDFKKINPALSYLEIIKNLGICYGRMCALDYFENIIRKNIGFQENEGEFEALHKEFLRELETAYSLLKINSIYKKYKRETQKIKTNKPERPLRVGIVGEVYVLMEPFSSFYIEKELAKKGIEVHRLVTVSAVIHEMMIGSLFLDKHIKHAKPYLQNHIGAHGTETVARAQSMIKQGFDGIIHAKPFGCMPEVNAMPALNRMAKDYRFPILYFSFDSQTSKAGITTRLEAFYDMLIMKKNAQY